MGPNLANKLKRHRTGRPLAVCGFNEKERSWMVKLRREGEEMTVVIGQTREGAQHLARRLNDFLN